MDLRQGDVVLVQIPDPLGNECATPHPAMVITRTDAIMAGKPIWVAAISTKYSEPLPAGWLKAPWRTDPPHPKTGLTKPCVLKCDWLVQVDRSRIIDRLGGMPTDIIEWAIEWIQYDVATRRARKGSGS